MTSQASQVTREARRPAIAALLLACALGGCAARPPQSVTSAHAPTTEIAQPQHLVLAQAVSGGTTPPTTTPMTTPTTAPPANAEPIAPATPAATTATATSGTATTGTPPPAEDHPSGVGRTAGFLTLALGTSAAAIAIGTSIMLVAQNSARSSACDSDKVCTQAGIDANAKISALNGWNAGAWAVAAVGIGVGAYLLFTNPADTTQRTAIGVGPNGSGVGLNLRSIF